MPQVYFQQDGAGKLHLVTLPTVTPQPCVSVEPGDSVRLHEGSFPVGPRLTRKRNGRHSLWFKGWRLWL